jgi:hypothetical protein
MDGDDGECSVDVGRGLNNPSLLNSHFLGMKVRGFGLWLSLLCISFFLKNAIKFK